MEKKTQIKTQALGKNIRVSVSKMRCIIDRIRNTSYEESLVLLEFMPYRASYLVSQLVVSAAANASTNLGLNKSNLFISEVWANNSTYLRRFRPRAQGRGYPIKKPICEVTIKLSSKIVKKNKP
ncbi:hypothetical protein KP509_01G055900 [Ceratopteris richardii]|uniref:Large ribosomal subunit protein uL22c n=1 Tax=Ceratopteris richardii TaxID=49495 RepID=A0A8T2VK04_CERRI|nr:hypothetical protein KP509_01G055900 [Ceratopteris richardii]